MAEEKEREFWTLHSENVPFQKGWFYRAFDMQEFMKKIESDPRGGKIIGMNFDGRNVEFYTQVTPEQMENYWENTNVKT